MGCEDKKSLRNIVKQRAAQMDPARHSAWSAAIMARIEGLEAFRRARTVALYWPLPDEVDTRDFIRKWSGEKRIVLPVTQGNEMVFKTFTDRLEPGALGIEEPVGGQTAPPSRIDLLIVPGLAFSPRCQRLGRGKGFYDRFLADSAAYKVGVCFTERLVESIACDPHDIDMDVVVTESGEYFSE